MRPPRIEYYCGLVHHADSFAAGRPVLVYHRVGPRPPGALAKALFVSEALFRRQLRELEEAGFRGASLDDPSEGPGNPGRRIVLTFDDGYESAFRHATAPLAEHGFRAIQFLVAGLIGGRNEWDLPSNEVPERLMDAAHVRDWLAAGHQIGAHTMTHPHLCRLPRAQAREEIAASKKALEDRFGVPVEHFCYPYGEWDEPVRDLVAEAGYRTACTTRPGLNDPGVPPFELRRLMACAPIRTPRQVMLRLLSRWELLVRVRPDPPSG